MKRIVGLGILAALLLALPLAQVAVAAKGGTAKVWLCHFGGHDGDVAINEALIERCENAGGNAIRVSWNAACYGHGVQRVCNVLD